MRDANPVKFPPSCMQDGLLVISGFPRQFFDIAGASGSRFNLWRMSVKHMRRDMERRGDS